MYRSRGSGFARFLVFILPELATPAAFAPPGITDVVLVNFDIVKVDPNPVAPNSNFTLVVQFTNLVDRPFHLSVQPKTDAIASAVSMDLAPRATRILELPGRFANPGTHDAAVSASWQTDRTRFSFSGGWLRRVPIYEPLGDRFAAVTVPAPGTTLAPPQFVDLSPDEPRHENGGDVASGVVDAIEGTHDALFVIAKSAGVWRSVNGAPWVSLPGGPPRAFSLAIDPNNRNHLAVGERADDNPDARVGRSGLWESADFGNSWFYTYDPTPAAGSQQIPAVAFSPKTSTLFIATYRGVARRERSNTASPFFGDVTYGQRDPKVPGCGVSAPADLGGITALVASETRIWARSPTEIFFSDDDGRNWSCASFPVTVDVPGSSNLVANYSTTAVGANDNAALGAFDDRAFIIFKPTVPANDPRALVDDRCNPAKTGSFIAGFNACELNNVSPLLIFNPAASGAAQWVAQNTNDNDGRGANGRRFVRTLSINAFKCPAYANRAIGVGRQVIYGAGQGVQQALSLGADGRLLFDTPAGSTIDSSPRQMHPDWWGFLLPGDYCPPQISNVFVATDGGIYEGKPSGSGEVAVSKLGWETRSEGLHVHTAQSLVVVESSTVPPPTPGVPVIPLQHIGYPTQDNAGWWRLANGSWAHDSLGDSNFMVGDIGHPSALSWRRPDSGLARLFSASAVSGPITLNRAPPFDGPTAVQAIQSLAGETPPNDSIDLVMLVQLPLQDAQQNDVADPPGGAGSGSRLALIRNSNLASEPNGPASSFAGWQTVSDRLPMGTERFWVAGGHAKPSYYIYTNATNTTCPNGLHRLVFSIAAGSAQWRCLIQNLFPPGTGDVVVQQGPAFVDPFDPNIVVVSAQATATAPPLLRLSVNGGREFCDLPALTALVTESGRYSLTASYSPDGSFSAVGSRFHGYPLAVPSHISFNRHLPAQMLVASPYTGLYVGTLTRPAGDAPLNCADVAWRDLTPYLPGGHTYVSATALLGGSAIVASEGRGVFAISNTKAAQVASYIEPLAGAASGTPIAVLHQADGAALPWGRIQPHIVPVDSNNPVFLWAQVRADGAGAIFAPQPLASGTYVVDLKFPGDGVAAPSGVKYKLVVP